MKLILFTFTFAIFTISCTQPDIKLTDDELHSVDSILVDDVPEGAPGIAIGIVRNGEVIYENYAGLSSLEDSLVIGPETRFNIASNGKQFTALAVLQLIGQQRLHPDDDIRKFFPDLYPDIEDPITITHLLTHSSGIRDYYDILSLQGKRWWQFTSNNEDVLDVISNQRDLNFKPGNRYLYSNSNYILLAEIIANVSGTPFVTYTGQMFDDLGMQSTSFENDHTYISGSIAMPYFNFETWTTYNWINNIVGDGALFSSLRDQLKWEQTIQTHKPYPVSADVIEKSQQPVSGSEIINYGYGIEFGFHQSEKMLYHTGATGAWKAITYRFPEKSLSIVVLTNSGKVLPEYTANAISDVLLDNKLQATDFETVPQGEGKRVERDGILGVYQNERGFTFRFQEFDEELYLLRDGRNDTRLVRESASVFYQWNDPSFKLEFTVKKDSEMTVTAYHTSHAPYSLTRLKSDFSDFNLKKLDGNFENTETSALLEIAHVKDQNYNVTLSGREYSGILLKPDLLKVNSYSIGFSGAGDITEVYLDGDRIKNVAFKRPD